MCALKNTNFTRQNDLRFGLKRVTDGAENLVYYQNDCYFATIDHLLYKTQNRGLTFEPAMIILPRPFVLDATLDQHL